MEHEYSQPPILPSPHFRWVAILLKTIFTMVMGSGFIGSSGAIVKRPLLRMSYQCVQTL